MQTIDLRAVLKIPKVWRDRIHVWIRYSEGWFEKETPVMMGESVATSRSFPTPLRRTSLAQAEVPDDGVDVAVEVGFATVL